MRVLVIVKGTSETEAGIMPDEKYLGEMMNYNEALVNAGIMLAAEGLHPSSKGARVKFPANDGEPTVIDGPFVEAKELVAGYWIWRVNSMEEAIEWVKRCPVPDGAPDENIEIRPILEAEDMGADVTPELREHVERAWAPIAGKK